MSLLEFVSALAEPSAYAVILTSVEPAPAGPRILYVNPAFERLTGYSAAEVVGGTPRVLQGRDTSASTLTRMRQAIRRGQPCQVVVVNYRKNGEPYRCAIALFPIAGPDGTPVAFAAIEHEEARR
ncbi:MAG TPA: PAS domain-containing protein, partial [Phenylobacterium sp.]